MKSARLAVFFAPMMLVACTSDGPAKSRLLNKAVLEAEQQRATALVQERAELRLTDGSSVNNCTDYLVRIASAGIEESLGNQLAKSEYLICEALDLIARSRPPAAIGEDYGRRLADSLDLRSFPSSLNMRSDNVAHTLSSVVAEGLVVDSVSVTIDVPDWHYRLELVAVRDINGNDTPDWIVWLADEAKQGSYRGYATLVVLDAGVSKELVASPYAPER